MLQSRAETLERVMRLWAIMVGGEQSAFDRVKPLFQCMGKNIAHMGPTGAGQHTKMSNQDSDSRDDDWNG